ncbi:hypothetical protein A1Q1_07945 [Trichosporon asahii var. asahii CBS 2479]|uniref:Uncharacterized protein n=1 Tax=Trichosporon asahii var. asahii (strain ATCC 90039 / CBS 2479 / JCM 2466 / KCTC 7840 / NBRC 103889/ NCYC 2677 / UAMH 7654) TaxID=1186058 RepID=J5R606_TRIAS|nr:hypothetical protein A1Q1_07945 [Trichosporon asahii var. asahii CBS 2479]EJT50883.1 hypothetical protein A1Q1_07945 [Trichosporon asahii var. asahii CBS 2479]
MAAIRLPRRLSQPHKQVEERRATSFLGLILPLVRRIPLSRVRIHAPLAPLGRLRRAIAQASQKARQLGGKPILKKHTRPPAPTPVENICSSDVGPDKTKVAGSGPAQEARTAAAEHDVAELEKRAAAAEHDVAELEKRAVAAEREVAKLQNRAAAAQRDVAAAAARAEGAQQAYVKVVDRLLQAEAAVVAASARAVAAEGRAREAERAGNDIARQLPLVQRDLHHAQAEVASERAYADQTLEKHNEQQAELRRIIDAWAEPNVSPRHPDHRLNPPAPVAHVNAGSGPPPAFSLIAKPDPARSKPLQYTPY